MARSQSLFRTQTRGLLLRTWHWERRKYCNIVCNYFLPPFFIILLKILQNVITSDPDPVFPFQRNPAGAFAPRPFDPARCLQRADDIESSAALRFCEQNPFLLDYPVPVLAPAALSDAIGSRNALDSSDDSGLMEGFSLQPFIFPGALRGQSFFTQQNSYDGVLLHASFDGNSTSSVYQQLLDAEEDNTVDQNYRLHTKPFESKQELFSTLYDSWYKGSIFNKFYSAFSFEQYEETDTSLSISTTVFYNESSSTNCTDSCPLVSNLVHMENAIYQRLNPGKTAIAFLRRMPPILNEEDLGFLQLVISIFIGLTSHFLLPFFLRFLVFERVARLRALMSIMGLKSRQYWFGTYIGLLTQFFLSQAFTLIIAGLAGVAFYVDNTPISYLLLFFLWGNVLIAHAMLLAPFFRSPESAQIVGWLFVILINIIGGPYIGQRLDDEDTSESTWSTIMILPSFAYLRSVYYAGAINSGGKGITISSEIYQDVDLGMCNGDTPFCRSYAFLAVQWIVMMVLAAYFDRVLPSAQPTRLHPLYFLGFKRKFAKHTEADDMPFLSKGKDVLEEESRAHDIVSNIQTVPFDGVVLDKLSKTYPGKPPVKALQGLSLVARKGEVVCILAHNGAGKTTAFRTLVGELGPTTGTAYVYGNSIVDQIDQVHRNMGVAPQQNILWNTLTVQEHLYFYGRLKNLHGRELKQAVDTSLEAVQLAFARKRPVQALSGGMKRRLSVSIAMIGNPEFIVLDEPSSGLDILAREKLWNAINRIKHDKTILLTTHSLDEAETLSNRVAIMSQGRLMCIGKSEDLKLRLGKGHHLSVSLPEHKVKALHDAVMEIAPEATLENVFEGSVEYVLPRSFAISRIFTLMGERRHTLMIRDWSVNQSTLEDVFMSVTLASRQEAAAKEDAETP